MRVNLTNLFTIRKGQGESIDDYLASIRTMKNWCFTPILESEMVKMATNSLDYSIGKKPDNLQFCKLAQLAEKVWQI